MTTIKAPKYKKGDILYCDRSDLVLSIVQITGLVLADTYYETHWIDYFYRDGRYRTYEWFVVSEAYLGKADLASVNFLTQAKFDLLWNIATKSDHH